jgi:hypothetical protein
MTALAKHEPQSTEIATVQDYGGGLLAVIERAARDPSVDIDKMERLIAMQERVQAGRAKAAYSSALADMQAEIPAIEKNGKILNKGVLQSTYAKWEDVNDAIRPVLAKHGFGLSFRVERVTEGVAVTGVLSHREGHSEQTTLSLPIDASGAKNNVQGYGSSVSYGKRYTASALLNLTSTDEHDDDGSAAGSGATIDDRQLGHIRTLIDDTGSDVARFCKFFNVEALPDLPAARYEEAIRQLNAKASKKPAGDA